MLDLERLDSLREAMLHEEDLAAVMVRFLNDFGDDPEFLRRGFTVEEPELRQLVVEVLGRATGRRPGRAEFRLRRLAPTPFVHGVALFDGRPATLLWFDDAGVGLLTVVTDGGAEHVRFRAFLVASDDDGSGERYR